MFTGIPERGSPPRIHLTDDVFPTWDEDEEEVGEDEVHEVDEEGELIEETEEPIYLDVPPQYTDFPTVEFDTPLGLNDDHLVPGVDY